MEKEVTQDEFFALLKADGRDIMPSHLSPAHTAWLDRNRNLWGRTTPGWKNPGGEKHYFVVTFAPQS
jgi:hypothetical protein